VVAAVAHTLSLLHSAAVTPRPWRPGHSPAGLARGSRMRGTPHRVYRVYGRRYGMGPAPSVTFLLQMLGLCEKRAGGEGRRTANVPRSAGSMQPTYGEPRNRDKPSCCGAAPPTHMPYPHAPSPIEPSLRLPSLEGREHEVVMKNGSFQMPVDSLLA
jgi:hypothetical protein